MDLKVKKIIVVGLARSGVGAANLLASMGCHVTVTDMKGHNELDDALRRLSPSVRTALGGHPEDIFLDADIVVVSPGVPLDIGPIRTAEGRGAEVIGELELAFRCLDRTGGRGIPFLAVTGSNGKSTTTTLLNEMMGLGGHKTLFGGNIGNALTEEIHALLLRGVFGLKEMDGATVLDIPAEGGPDYVVAEVSSFQLEAIRSFRPHVASVLNITPDHMDRYHSMSEYAAAKARIFERQTEGDFLVVNADDPETMAAVRPCLSGAQGPLVVPFSRKAGVEGIYCIDGTVRCALPGLPRNMELIGAEEIRIKGVHNLENAMAASAMALLAGCRVDAVRAALREFGGLEHRLELVRVLDGVSYINDSKGTNVGAVIKSIESFASPLILIAGGRDKAGDFEALRGPVSGRVKALVLIGEAAGKIGSALGDITEAVYAGDLKEAVSICRKMASSGDVVLLSPACASFDMFRDFEDRGRQFKEIVRGLN